MTVDGHACYLFMYCDQIICYWLIFECFSLKKLTAMLKIENPLTDRCMRDELKFPKVSSGLLCGMEEDHFC